MKYKKVGNFLMVVFALNYQIFMFFLILSNKKYTCFSHERIIEAEKHAVIVFQIISLAKGTVNPAKSSFKPPV